MDERLHGSNLQSRTGNDPQQFTAIQSNLRCEKQSTREKLLLLLPPPPPAPIPLVVGSTRFRFRSASAPASLSLRLERDDMAASQLQLPHGLGLIGSYGSPRQQPGARPTDREEGGGRFVPACPYPCFLAIASGAAGAASATGRRQREGKERWRHATSPTSPGM